MIEKPAQFKKLPFWPPCLQALLGFIFIASLSPSLALSAEEEVIVGRIAAWRSGKVSTQVPGLVQKMQVKEGDRVKKGDVIAVFDTSRLKLDVARLEGALATAHSKVDIAIAERNLKQNILMRQAKLKHSRAFLISKYEEAQLKLAIAKAGVKAAKADVATQNAALKRKKLDIALSTIRAPYGGIVKRLFTQQGAFVIPEAPHLVELVDDNSLEIEVDIPVRYVHMLKPGQQVVYRLDGKSHKARLRAVLPLVNPRSQTRAVRFSPLDLAALKNHAIGQNTDVLLPRMSKKALQQALR